MKIIVDFCCPLWYIIGVGRNTNHKTKERKMWYDYEGNQHSVEELEIGTQTALYGGDRRNFFFAKNDKRVKFCGRESGSIFVVRVA